MTEDLTWIAPREGQDWRDDDSLAAIDWLTSLVSAGDWESRIAAANARFQAAKAEWAQGRRVPLFDPEDQIAWYLLQTRCYSDPGLRHDYFEPDGFRIAPVVRRIGHLLPDLQLIVGADERAGRLMTHGRKTPDDGLYELLVAGAYKRRGWARVEFVPETPGVGKTPDLLVDRGRTHRAVECKRAGRSGYAEEERSAGERMATRAHELAQAEGRSTILLVKFRAELTDLPSDYLETKALRLTSGRDRYMWDDEGSEGMVADVLWGPLQQVLEHDDIYFGGSRMTELLIGGYDPSLDFSVSGDWTPAEGRPFHAYSVSRISLVAWISQSAEAARRKASHFRSVVGRASDQLPGDRPGVIHVGYEAAGGNSVDGLRHRLNRDQMRTFNARESRLQGVYGNYLMPEHVTARDESAAVSETTAWYPVGRPTTPEPLPSHLLLMDEDGVAGAHFRR